MMNWTQFNSIPNGTRVLNHGWDQCVALANLYHEDVIGGSFVPVGSAYQWWTEFWNFRTLTDNYTPSNTAVPGAIFVARYGLYDAPNGHIGVVTHVNPDGSFNTMEQNAGTWRYVGRYHRGYTNVLGFLIPKKNPAKAPAKPVVKPEPTPEWEDTLYAFSGKSTRKKAQKIKGGSKETVTFLDSHSDSKFGDRTIARGKGSIVGLNVNVRVKGEPGTRVNYELVRETGQNKNRVVIGEERVTLDTFGAGTAQIGFSGDLASGQLIRLVAQVQEGKTVEVERFYWSGMARSG